MFDVTGAGDTVITVLTLALAAGATLVEAAHLANLAAGPVVRRLGAATAAPAELEAAVNAFGSTVMPPDESGGIGARAEPQAPDQKKRPVGHGTVPVRRTGGRKPW